MFSVLSNEKLFSILIIFLGIMLKFSFIYLFEEKTKIGGEINEVKIKGSLLFIKYKTITI